MNARINPYCIFPLLGKYCIWREIHIFSEFWSFIKRYHSSFWWLCFSRFSGFAWFGGSFRSFWWFLFTCFSSFVTVVSLVSFLKVVLFHCFGFYDMPFWLLMIILIFNADLVILKPHYFKLIFVSPESSKYLLRFNCRFQLFQKLNWIIWYDKFNHIQCQPWPLYRGHWKCKEITVKTAQVHVGHRTIFLFACSGREISNGSYNFVYLKVHVNQNEIQKYACPKGTKYQDL